MTWGIPYVSWPPPGPRTETAYDCEECTPWNNLRYVKWGPKGGRWERGYVRVAAHGPPVEERRHGIGFCWLCNAKLKEHQRKWTRPGWTRTVAWGRRVQLPYEDTRVHGHRPDPPIAWGRCVQPLFDDTRVYGHRRNPPTSRVVYQSTKEEPSSQLEMTIYSCPNGCDADDTLQALLDQTDHTGPERAPGQG